MKLGVIDWGLGSVRVRAGDGGRRVGSGGGRWWIWEVRVLESGIRVW